MRALCLGSAACKDDDLKRARGLGISVEYGWTLIAVNHAARDWPGELPHRASYHPNLFSRGRSRARAARFPAGRKALDGNTAAHPAEHGHHIRRQLGGSSGLLAVTVAKHLGATAAVCCGILLDRLQGHYDSPEKPWRDASNYRHGWTNHKDSGDLANVKSMSGWTAELLGEPDRAWVDRIMEKETV